MRIGLKLVVVAVPLALLLVVGVAAAVLARCLIWVDDRCQDWFQAIYYGK